jgi:transcriptional antiterminator RfaH
MATIALLDGLAEETLAKNWYVIHTKPRQEQRALKNLQQQGYQCYLPMMAIEKLSRERVSVIEEPLFPRYLFICLDLGRHGQNWSPIRSTWGVSGLVAFGSAPAMVDGRIIDFLRLQEPSLTKEPVRLFYQGESLLVVDGPFAGLEAIYQMASGENRASVLIELMGKSAQMQIAPASLRKIG